MFSSFSQRFAEAIKHDFMNGKSCLIPLIKRRFAMTTNQNKAFGQNLHGWKRSIPETFLLNFCKNAVTKL